MSRILQSIYSLLSSVCSKSNVHFIQLWFLTRYRIVNVILYPPLRLSPTTTLQRVGDSPVRSFG